MTIAEARDKCKSLIGRVPRDILIISVLILACLFSFGLGYLAGLDAAGEGSPLSITTSPLIATSSVGQVLASKTGSKYYLAWCSGAERITEENKVWFASPTLAKAAGYAPATNCDGI